MFLRTTGQFGSVRLTKKWAERKREYELQAILRKLEKKSSVGNVRKELEAANAETSIETYNRRFLKRLQQLGYHRLVQSKQCNKCSVKKARRLWISKRVKAEKVNDIFPICSSCYSILVQQEKEIQ